MFLKNISNTNLNESTAWSTSSNPITAKDNETLNNMVNLFEDFHKFFQNKEIDNIIENEVGRKNTLLNTLVKEKLFCK